MHASKKTRTSVVLLFLAALLSGPVQRTARAQATACPGNLVVNGNFTNGLAAGPMPSPGAVANWSRAYGTPDVSAGMGCQDVGFVGMWGNLNPAIGEGLHQNLMPALVGGKTYLVSLCVRHGNDPDKQLYSMFRVRASGAQLTSVTGGLTVGLTGSIPPPNWTPVNFIWTAPTGSYQFLTINVENLLSTADGAKTSYGHVDNVCIQELAITAAAVCQGQPTAFSSNATGATSWNWNFGDNTPSVNQQNPTHTYANAGTYTVQLCVNGTTSCVTKPVTVNPKPPTPVIIGSNNLCNGLKATYSVAPVSGVTYTWTVSNGTISGSSTGSSVNVTWNSTGGGFISVTATNAQGCSAGTRMQVFDCKVWLEKCCDGMNLNATAPNPVHVGNNVYTLTPTLTTPNIIIRVVANVISTEQTFSNASCGTNGPVSSYVVSASPAPSGFTPSLPVAFSQEVIWHGPGVNLSGGLAFPFQIKFPPPPGPKGCFDTLKFCVKYTFTTSNCRSCEIIRCYSIVRKKISTELPD